MRFVLILAAAVAQDPQLPPSPVQRIVISPAPATMTAQDTLRLQARALDANGRDVPGVVFRFLPSRGARFEGTVEEDGLVRSGATGTLPVTIPRADGSGPLYPYGHGLRYA